MIAPASATSSGYSSPTRVISEGGVTPQWRLLRGNENLSRQRRAHEFHFMECPSLCIVIAYNVRSNRSFFRVHQREGSSSIPFKSRRDDIGTV